MYEIGPFEYTTKNKQRKISCPQKIVINKNELVIIAGPSGGGKSTLLQMLKGIIPEFSAGKLEGDLLYKGHPLSKEFFQKNLKEILFLFQNPFSQLIYPSVAEEFFFSMENFNYSREEMEKKKAELEDLFELESLWNKKTNELSTGECQKLVLASLLAIEPEVLLLDEPTAFLDPEARKDFYQWLSSIKGTRTIIIVDHHLDEILPFADKIVHVTSDGLVSLEKFLPENAPREKVDLFKNQGAKKEVQVNIEHLFFHYPNQSPLLEDVTLSARSEDIIVVKGKNGKGKSTFFKLVASILKPIRGSVEVKVNGKSLAPKKQYKEMGFIFQNPESHFFYDTINEELKIENSKQDLKTLLQAFLKNIDLNRSPFLLSEGEKRRLSILMTVFQDKSVLFYDEPTFGQDKENIAIIREIVLHLKEMGKIQFIISHDEEFIRSLDAGVYELKNYHLERAQ
ncbi:MAG: ATP-binding cassette domain-containing protein [Bacteriovorax sp.]